MKSAVGNPWPSCTLLSMCLPILEILFLAMKEQTIDSEKSKITLEYLKTVSLKKGGQLPSWFSLLFPEKSLHSECVISPASCMVLTMKPSETHSLWKSYISGLQMQNPCFFAELFLSRISWPLAEIMVRCGRGIGGLGHGHQNEENGG